MSKNMQKVGVKHLSSPLNRAEQSYFAFTKKAEVNKNWVKTLLHHPMVSVIRSLPFVSYFMKFLWKLCGRVNFSSLNQPFLEQQYIQNGQSKQRGAEFLRFFQKGGFQNFPTKRRDDFPKKEGITNNDPF